MMNRPAIRVLLVVLAVAAVWALFRPSPAELPESRASRRVPGSALPPLVQERADAAPSKTTALVASSVAPGVVTTGTITVVVVDANDAPILDTDCEAVPVGGPVAPGDHGGRAAIAEPHGRCVLTGLLPRVYRVDVHSADHLSRTTTVDGLASGPRHVQVTVRLTVGASISGRVVDRAGQPAPFAAVEAVPADFDLSFRRGSPSDHRTISDDAGRFTLQRLAGGSFILVAGSYAKTTFLSGFPGRPRVTVPAEGRLEGIELTLPPPAEQAVPDPMTELKEALSALGLVESATTASDVATGRVRGRVVGEDDDVVATAFVTATRTGEPVPVDFGRPGADGAFELKVPPGEWEIAVEAIGYAPARKKVALTHAGETVAGVDLVLGAGATLRGTVVSPTGAPVDGALVEAGHVDVSGVFVVASNAYTDARGEYVVEHLEPGAHSLRARHAAYAPSKFGETYVDGTSPATAPALALQVGNVLLGRVRRGGQPQVDMRVELATPEGQPLQARTDEEGRFSFVKLTDGDYTIELYDPESTLMQNEGAYASFDLSGPPIHRQRVTLANNRTTPVEVALRTGVTVSGIIRGVAAIPLRFASLHNPDQFPEPIRTARVDAEGRFRFRNVPEGTYEVSVTDLRSLLPHRTAIRVRRRVQVELQDLDLELNAEPR